jgi:hypothetical protein
MRETRMRMRIPLRIRARAAALAPAVAALAVAATSPMGAELALADGSSAAQGSAGVVYGGLTSNGWPVVVEVTRNGRLIKRAVGAIRARCSQGGSFTLPSQWRFVRISRNGAFKASYDDSWVDEGTEVTVSESFVGKFNRPRTALTGTWRASTTIRMPDGTVDVCDSGSLRVTARQ